MDPHLTKEISTFPWETLPQVSRRDIEAHRQSLQAFPGFADVRDTASALSALLSVPCEITPLTLAQGFLAPLYQGVAIEFELEGPDRQAVLVECDLALVLSLLSIVGKTPAPTLIDTENADAPTPRICGAAAAIAMYLVRRGPGKVLPLSLKGTAPAENALLAFCNDESGAEPIYASYTVVVGAEAYLTRVWLRATPTLRPERPLELAHFGRAALSLKVVLTEEVLKTAELAALQSGDVWVLPRKAHEGADRLLSGPVFLAAAQSEVGLRATLRDGKLVYDGEIVDVGPAARLQHPAMSDDRVFGEVPVSVRVEVGAVEIAAREWARLRAGDTLTLQKRLGDPVVLRVAGIEVARGELVNVEGEIGVRILEKHAGSGTEDSVDTQVVPT